MATQSMSRLRVNDVELFYELTGEGEPVVLVHGSWGDHHGWDAIVPSLASSFKVLTYDRRGHSQSDRPASQGFRREDEDDLARLIEELELAPAHVAGNSFGASITLGLVARRPELFRSLIAHEPPLVALVAEDPDWLARLEPLQAVLRQIQSGNPAGGAEQFMDGIGVGRGAWEHFPPEVRDTCILNAPTFLDEQLDPSWADIDRSVLSDLSCPALLTKGTESLPYLLRIMEKLTDEMPQAEVGTIIGAGHIPHRTHPTEYLSVLVEFLLGVQAQ
ncbi:MAG: alpha/beta fold hydrolase [Actinomycetota bacterium]